MRVNERGLKCERRGKIKGSQKWKSGFVGKIPNSSGGAGVLF
jgi:hypothetical protein